MEKLQKDKRETLQNLR